MSNPAVVGAARHRQRDAEAGLDEALARLQSGRAALDAARRRGEAGRSEVSRLEDEVRRLSATSEQARADLVDAASGTKRALGDFELLARPQTLVEQRTDSCPFLLLPVRLECRFALVGDQHQLWVRIFPDDVAVHVHEETLTDDELETGRTFWKEVWIARQETDPDEVRRLELGAWRVLAGEHDGPRAAWVARRTEPADLTVGSVDQLDFGTVEAEDLKDESWTRAPRSYVMPDRFVVMTFTGGERTHEVVGAQVPDPLVLGPNPSAAEPDLAQVDGDLAVSDDLAWLYDLEAAVQAGMAVRIDISAAEAENGFDRALVLGLRLSSDEAESAELIGELLDNHHYAPEGMSLLPQGSPTNNTQGRPSAYRSIDPGAETSFAVEMGDPLFTPVGDGPRGDGQLLAEALGIGVERLQHLRHADGRDTHEALTMNTALWPATLGYYTNDLLGLGAQTIGDLRGFFERYVTGRGPLPAIRVGVQPYGILPTSALSRWEWSDRLDGGDLTFLRGIQRVLDRATADWASLMGRVPRAGASGDEFENLLSILGLDATSVERHRRHAVGPGYVVNWATFAGENNVDRLLRGLIAVAAKALATDLGLDAWDSPPLLFELAFFSRQDPVLDPLIERAVDAEREQWSETRELEARYQLPGVAGPLNYIGWLRSAPHADLKAQTFRDAVGEPVPAPDALLYRYLRRALLLAYHDVTVQLFASASSIGIPVPRRETELVDMGAQPTVSRWRLMEAPLTLVDPDGPPGVTILEHLQLESGLSRPQAGGLRALLDALAVLEHLPTARLERLFSEHLDLCSYRLDAWQTGFVTRRLEQQRAPVIERVDRGAAGTHLGAYGWLEDLRPRPRPVVVDPAEIPEGLRDPDGAPIVEQPDNGGFIHGPSLNHAVAAAVLRNAYLTHAEPEHPERMAVNLSSGRVRTALRLIEGVRHGQELGALLGYQFERGLHDRHGLPDTDGLERFLEAFREAYPLVADRITPADDGEPLAAKQARHVVDGYAMVEATVFADPPLAYPYGVAGLPPAASAEGVAIRDEVDRLAASLDALGDLALAEGVFQVTQGNYERVGAMARAMADGSNPPEPEIVNTPRSGAVLHHRVALRVAVGPGPAPWPGPPTPRARALPGLNTWLGQVIGPPERIRFVVESVDPPAVEQSLTVADLGLQPIDLVLVTGDDVHEAGGGEGSRDDTTELESRIAFLYRRRRRAAGLPPAGDLTIRFVDPDPSWSTGDITVFEILPLLRGLRRLVTGCRPLTAVDLRLPSESTADPDVDPDPAGYDLVELQGRVEESWNDFSTALDGLTAAVGAARLPGAGEAELDAVRDRLHALADFGMSSAFPHDAVGAGGASFPVLLAQGDSVAALGTGQRDRARRLQDDLAGLTPAQQVAQLRDAARLVLGPPVNLLPSFRPKNPDELEAAAGRVPASALVVEEWVQGLMRVRERMGTLELVRGLHEAFAGGGLELGTMQLPHRDGDPWIGVEYPGSFVPQGEYLSIVHHGPVPFDPRGALAGLVVDEWNEVIPGRRETTGVAVHYDQPSSEPPQVLLLAVTPVVTGTWRWDDLVAVLHDTLDRAQRRAVEPDHLGVTAYGQVLPALLTSVSTYPFATISTALTHATEVAFAANGSDDR